MPKRRLVGIRSPSRQGWLISLVSSRRRQPGTMPVTSHAVASTCSKVGTGPLNGLAAKSARPSLSCSATALTV